MWKVTAKTPSFGAPDIAKVPKVDTFDFTSATIAMAVVRQWAEQGLLVTVSFTPKVKK